MVAVAKTQCLLLPCQGPRRGVPLVRVEPVEKSTSSTPKAAFARAHHILWCKYCGAQRQT
jgi:hypothetical protein